MRPLLDEGCYECGSPDDNDDRSIGLDYRVSGGVCVRDGFGGERRLTGWQDVFAEIYQSGGDLV